MLKILKFLIAIYLLAYGLYASHLSRKTRQSQQCTLPGSEENGQCQKLSQCQSARLAFDVNKTPPVYCSYDASDPIVCCSVTKTEGVEKSLPITPSGKSNTSDQQRRRISFEKCQETFFPKINLNSFKLASSAINVTSIIYHGIVLGTRTVPGEFVHMAAIGWWKLEGGYDYLCGGTLISPQYVLTAAHCANVHGAEPSVVLIGGDTIDGKNENPKIPITQISVHPKYSRKQFYNDIALLQLKYNSHWAPACLWQEQHIDYNEATAIGYGHTVFAGKGSEHLLKADLNIFPNEECKAHYPATTKFKNSIVDTQICAGDPNKQKDTCQGDSGGLLMVKVNESDKVIPYILGVTSFGQGCAGGTPSIYVRASSYLDRIESIVWIE